MAKTQLKFPMLIQVKEKHSNYVKIVNSIEEIQVIALEVAKERKEANYYWIDKTVEENATFEEFYESRHGIKPEKVEEILLNLGGNPDLLPHEETATFDMGIPKFSPIKGSFYGLSQAKQDFSMRKLENQRLEKFFDALEKEDGETVMKFLFSRSRDGYEYEGFDYLKSDSNGTFDLTV